MSLKARIQEDVKTAMRAGDKERLATLRMISAAIKQRVLELLTSDEVFVVLREYRQRIVDFSPDPQPETPQSPVVAELALP